MLTSTDKQLGFPQMALSKRQMGTEVWSTDYYGFEGSNGGTIGEIQDRISALEDLLASKNAQLTTAKKNNATAIDAWNACNTTDCKSHHSKSRCNECRKKPNADMAKYSAVISSLKGEIAQIKRDIADWEKALTEAQKIATELVAQGRDLAKFGETPESILAKTQAKEKNRRMLIGVGIGVAVIFTGIYIYNKVRKRNK